MVETFTKKRGDEALDVGKSGRSLQDLPPGPKLNLGRGPVQLQGWINVDGSNRACESQRQMAFPKSGRSAAELRVIVQSCFRDVVTRRIWFGSLGHSHKWQFDEVQLVEMFERAGLTDVERRAFHASRISDIGSVERSDFASSRA
jgi:hypothetical protein